METDCHRANQKPARCPECGSRRIVDILYGYPALELLEAAGREEIVLGGCVIDDDMPQWQCVACDTQIHPNLPCD